ncbi:MAG: hypothetical protein NC342_05185 [Pseudoflavonifractor sp.]|nr:N-acetyltransferase [Alloprevotella sp.]MCM1116910.1 hypothetical protein [Pseudoflavonifractor sp.]
MSVEVREVSLSRRNIKKFIEFGNSLYKGNDCYVPPLLFDEIDTFNPAKNPALDFCDLQLFMAYRDGRPAGRIAAIINRKLNEASKKHEARFGWIEFVDDDEVVDALMDAAESWARSKGMTEMIGPMGFTDLDHEGMLTFGFDELGTIATIYNHPYYPTQIKRRGYVKDAGWVEFRMTVPDRVPDKYQRIADIVRRKYGLQNLHFSNIRDLAKEFGRPLFHLINRAYKDLYGYSQLSDRQIDYYIKHYLSVLRLDCISVIVDADRRLVGVGISMPSLSRALQKGGGKLFPMGWFHLLKAIKGHNDIVDLMLIAVEPEYQSKGVNALLFADLLPNYIRNGYKYAESNLELETNNAVQAQWQYFENRLHRRRESFRKSL